MMLGKREEVVEYFETNAASKSFITQLLKGPAKQDLSKNKAVKMGSAVDSMLTQGKKAFDEEYYVTKVVVRDNVREIIDHIFANQDNLFASQRLKEGTTTLLENEDLVLDAADMYEYQPTYRAVTRVKNIIGKQGEGEVYFRELKESQGKTIISEDFMATVDAVCGSLKTSEVTRELFTAPERGSKIQIIYQVPIYWETTIKGSVVDCKSLLDIVVIDHDKKTVTPVDLKTTGDSLNSFDYVCSKYRYDIQAAFYTDALYKLVVGEYNARTTDRLQELFSGIDDYQVVGFKFVVESTQYPGSPRIYHASHSTYKRGKYGQSRLTSLVDKSLPFQDIAANTPRIVGKDIPGYIDALENYLWYLENNPEFDCNREYVTNKGVFLLEM